MVVLPISEIVFRRAFARGIPGSGPIVQHLTLWVGFLGAAIAAREGKLLALATGTFIPQGVARRAADILAAGFGACAAVLLAWGGGQMVAIERESATTIGAGIPAWVAQLVLPAAFALIAVRLVWRTGAPGAAALTAPSGPSQSEPIADAAGDSTLYTGRLSAGGRACLGSAAARVPRLLRMGPGRNGRRVRRAVLVLHGLHRRLGCHDPRAWRRALPRPDQRRLPREICARPADGLGIAR